RAACGLRPIVGMDRVEPAPALEALEALAGERTPAGLLGFKLARGRRGPDDRRRRLDQGPEAFLAVAQGQLGALPRGDVPRDSKRTDDPTLRVSQRHLGRGDPRDAVVSPRLLLELAHDGL